MSAYDDLSPRARHFLASYTELDLAAICADQEARLKEANTKLAAEGTVPSPDQRPDYGRTEDAAAGISDVHPTSEPYSYQQPHACSGDEGFCDVHGFHRHTPVTGEPGRTRRGPCLCGRQPDPGICSGACASGMRPGGHCRCACGTVGADEPDTVTIPMPVFDQLVKVAAHVSLGRSAAFTQDRPYPDATARYALGALHEAGHLNGYRQRHPEEA